ncbi:MAG: pyruvate/ketoisovalerate ferredoxin oxidoreductase subunit gamma [Myxococcota bacterium]
MLEIRFHGRGGQGAVVASKLLATSAFFAGKFSQSFPAFGVERRGAPVTAFIRIADEPIKIRTEIYEPDHIVILDPSLIEQISLTSGLKKGGIVVINSAKPPDEFKDKFKEFRVATVPASEIAVKHKLGTPQSPIVNTAILGGLAKALALVSIDDVVKAILDGVPAKAENNSLAAKEAYEKVTEPL